MYIFLLFIIFFKQIIDVSKYENANNLHYKLFYFFKIKMWLTLRKTANINIIFYNLLKVSMDRLLIFRFD